MQGATARFMRDAAIALFGLTNGLFAQSYSGSLAEHRVANIFRPMATPAGDERTLALLALAITGGIFAVVAGLLTYTLIRFRTKPTDDRHREPAQVYGSNQIELAWTVIPILIVFVLVGVTARVIAGVQDHEQTSSALRATIIGHQWWWEIRYPDLGIVTANELHVPVAGMNGHSTFLRLESVDVIHSFWVPQLSGKTDLIPNRANSMWIDPQQEGTYLGNCAEYCGTQHANMLLRVVAQNENEFNAWVAAQKKDASLNPQTPQGKATFESLACVSCHMVRGTSAKGTFGPDLTHLMSRQTIGAGIVLNTEKNLRDWVNDPQDIKPGCLMPSMKLSDPQLQQVVAYLQGLS